MRTSTILYQGDADGADFTVPEGSVVVYFNIHAPSGAVIEALDYSGTANGSVPLGYKLLPGFIANRLQGLLANENAIQRTVFFADGMKLFGHSPVFGLGMGSFENAIKSVQPFYYETKYAHNHYIQTLVETGVVGLVLFVGVIALSAAALWRSRRKHPLVPALSGCLIFMAGHAAVEVDLSYYSCMILFYAAFALIALIGGDALPKPRMADKLRIGGIALDGIILIVFFCLLCGNLSAKNTVERAPSLASFERAVKIDRYEWADYMLSYVVNSADSESADVRTKADAYALRLAQVDSNTIPRYLAEYYFGSGQISKAFAMAEKYVGYRSSESDAWQDIVYLLMAYQQDTEEYRTGVRRIAQLLEGWNEQNMGSIELSEMAAAFLVEAAS